MGSLRHTQHVQVSPRFCEVLRGSLGVSGGLWASLRDSQSLLVSSQKVSKGLKVPRFSHVLSGSRRSSQVLQGSPTFTQGSPRSAGFVSADSTKFAKSCFGSPRCVDVRHGSLAFVGCARVRSGSHTFTMVCYESQTFAKMRGSPRFGKVRQRTQNSLEFAEDR